MCRRTPSITGSVPRARTELVAPPPLRGAMCQRCNAATLDDGMTLDKVDTVDWLSIDKRTGHICLTVVDDWDWCSEREHVARLQDKLNIYLAFVESGEVYERLAEQLGGERPPDTRVRVEIVGKHRMPPYAERFLEHATMVFHEAGLALSYRLFRPADDDE